MALLGLDMVLSRRRQRTTCRCVSLETPPKVESEAPKGLTGEDGDCLVWKKAELCWFCCK